MKKTLFAIAAAGLLSSSSAFATVTFGDGGASLTSVLDGVTSSNTAGCTGSLGGDCPSTIDLANQAQPDAYWAISASGGSVATVVIQLGAYNTSARTFGVYDSANKNNYVQLFDGSVANQAGAQILLSIKLDGSVYVNNADTGINFSGNKFGYYLDSTSFGGGGLFYSDTNLNSDQTDHMAAYEGNGDTLQIGANAPGVFASNEYIMAWEDLNCNSGCDRNYSDFVALVESVHPVPAPATLALLGLGMLGFGIRARRNK